MNNNRQIFAKELRGNMTDAERLLWYHLRAHRLSGMKFKRQQPLGDYIVDFVCFGARLVIEVDGGQHLDNMQDQRRDTWLRSQGFEVLRFWNNEVLEQTDAVLERVLQFFSPSPPPLPHEGGGDKSLQRVRWRCRRGLLELDIVLGRFVAAHYARLDEAEKHTFDALLDMPDNPLWDMISGKREAASGGQRALLEKIRAV
ncbi:MAG: DUF559 domain-containing protein [Gallionella sp.]|nr:MAG: DUF559 domain-containing protein [Gallionella sp.]